MRPTKSRRQLLKLCAAGSAGALAGCTAGKLHDGGPLPLGNSDDDDDPEKIDDWQYDPAEHTGSYNRPSGGSGAQYEADAAAADDNIGLAAGGAADVGTFRRNVYEGYLPIPESMAYEGLFHEYYFDTGGDGSCSSLFCPTYTPAVTSDPLSGETERYLSVGLDSGLSQADFERPPLNLVIVLDVSGSMSSSFDDYYYDQFGKRQRVEGETNRPKIEVAKDVLADLTEHLRPADRLGVVLFNNRAKTAKPVRAVEETDMEAIREHIREDIQAGGGTNISAGMQEAEGLLDEVVDADEGYEHRTILLTDAQVNLGETDAGELQSNLEARAAKDMHTSFVGIGVDFNANLINQITSVRGANYYSVYSSDQFEQRLVEEFEYMVGPLVFDLSLELDAEGYEITQVYGSPSADEATGELMEVSTLFPSPSEAGKAKGGVVLVQVERTGAADGAGASAGAGDMELQASWEERDGSQGSATATVSVPDATEHWGNDAVRKTVLLARHANLLKQWAVEERDPRDVEEAYPDEEEGIEPPQVDLSKWELQSQPLSVSAEHAERLRAFREHLAAEMDAIGDDTLQQELELLDAILATA